MAVEVKSVRIDLAFHGHLVKCTRRYAILEVNGERIKVMRGQEIVLECGIYNIPALKDRTTI